MMPRHTPPLAVCAAFALAAAAPTSSLQPPPPPPLSPPGSSHFGWWHTDRFGLPAFRYSGHANASSLPLGHAPLEPAIAHQVGNDRVVAVALTNGEVSVRQDEGGPKLLHASSEPDSQYRGGFGYLHAPGGRLLASTRAAATVSPVATPGFSLDFGVGYVAKATANESEGVRVEHIVAAPFGDDAVLLSEVTVTDTRAASAPEARDGAAPPPPPRVLMWDEVWGQARTTWQLTGVSTSFRHRILASTVPQGKHTGSSSSSSSSATSGASDTVGDAVPVSLLVDTPTNVAPECAHASRTTPSHEDCFPAPAFLAAVGDGGGATADGGFTTSGSGYFGRGGAALPSGVAGGAPMDNSTTTTGADTVFVMRRVLVLPAGGSVTLHFVAGYAPPDRAETTPELAARVAASAPGLLASSSSSWRSWCSAFGATGPGLDADAVAREVQWHAYNLRAGLSYDTYRGEHILNQGGNYVYSGGLQGAARDPVSHVMPLIAADPNASKFVKEVVRYTLKEVEADPRTGVAGWIPWGQGGFGMEDSVGFWPSDLEGYLLLTASQYVLATRDFGFLNDTVVATNASTALGTVSDMLWTCFTHVRDSTGTSSATGLITLLNVDHNDGLLSHLKPSNRTEAQMHGSSVMNTALAVYAYRQFAAVLRLSGRGDRAVSVDAHADDLLHAVESAWAVSSSGKGNGASGGWYKRVHLGERGNDGWRGDERDGVMWTETQAWALLADTNKSRVPGLVAELDEAVRRPSPVGALNTGRYEGAGDYAGVWNCGNMALVAGLARHGYCDMAVDEFRKNLLAAHADAYPDVWFGVWSGPDTYNSVLMAQDPEWKGKPERFPGSTRSMTIGFPVMNMWTHTTPLYAALAWVGTTFTEAGVWFSPTFNKQADNAAVHGGQAGTPAFSVSTPLVGLAGSPGETGGFCCNFSGWYRPYTAGTFTVALAVTPAVAACCKNIHVSLGAGGVAAVNATVDGFSFAAHAGGLRRSGIEWRTVAAGVVGGVAHNSL